MSVNMRMNPASHPVGTRLVVQDAHWWITSPFTYNYRYEVTVLEWGPTAQTVKLRIEESKVEKWYGFMPWVLEVLPKEPPKVN